MNTNHDGTMDDDVLLDRLVDGELSDEEYRQAVASLDERPDGWRRCALAFLEAQALRRELGELAACSQQRQPGTAIPPATARCRLSMWPAAAVAASLLAFALGVGAAGFFRFERQDTTAAGNNTPRPHVAAAPSTLSAPPAAPRHEALRPVSSVRLMLNDGDGEPTELGQLPVVEVKVVPEPTAMAPAATRVASGTRTLRVLRAMIVSPWLSSFEG